MFSKEDEFPCGLITLTSYPPPSLPLPAAPTGLLQAGCPGPELIRPGKGPAWSQATRWSLATIQLTRWEPGCLCAQDLATVHPSAAFAWGVSVLLFWISVLPLP